MDRGGRREEEREGRAHAFSARAKKQGGGKRGKEGVNKDRSGEGQRRGYHHGVSHCNDEPDGGKQGTRESASEGMEEIRQKALNSSYFRNLRSRRRRPGVSR